MSQSILPLCSSCAFGDGQRFCHDLDGQLFVRYYPEYDNIQYIRHIVTNSANSPSDWEMVLVMVEDGTAQFNVHKLMLTSISPVFKAMFEFENSKEARENRVDIPDLEAEVFDAMLRYFYQLKIPPVMDKLADRLLVLADKYQMDSLKLYCEQNLSTKILITNVIDLLLLADLSNGSLLKSMCIDYVNVHSTDVMQTDQWKRLLNSSANNTKLIGDLYREMAIENSRNKLALKAKPPKHDKVIEYERKIRELQAACRASTIDAESARSKASEHSNQFEATNWLICVWTVMLFVVAIGVGFFSLITAPWWFSVVSIPLEIFIIYIVFESLFYVT